jgi:hypothetical protein
MADAVVFLIGVQEETFRLLLRSPALIAEAERHMHSGRVGVLSGVILRGDGGFNAPYSWHHDPSTIEFPDLHAESCDGIPSYVEANLDDFLRDGYFCPWGAQVLRRMDDDADIPSN